MIVSSATGSSFADRDACSGTARHGLIVGLRGEGPHRAPPLRSRADRARQVTPRRCATAAASTLLLTPSLRRMFETWTLAVFSDTNSASPICRFVWPAATRERTSASAWGEAKLIDCAALENARRPALRR